MGSCCDLLEILSWYLHRATKDSNQELANCECKLLLLYMLNSRAQFNQESKQEYSMLNCLYSFTSWRLIFNIVWFGTKQALCYCDTSHLTFKSLPELNSEWNKAFEAELVGSHERPLHTQGQSSNPVALAVFNGKVILRAQWMANLWLHWHSPTKGT
jgi:hypothetical protein